MDWLGALPACSVSVAVALVLVAESGLLIGLVLPGASLLIGIGVLAGAGLVPVPVAALAGASATVAGAAIGHRRAARAGYGALLPASGSIGRFLPVRVRRLAESSASPWVDAVGRRPVRMAAAAQFASGSRTLAPRIAARAGVPLPTMLRGTVPAALLWSWRLVASGAAAGAAAPRLNGVGAAAALLVVMLATWLLARRRAGATAFPQALRAPEPDHPVMTPVRRCCRDMSAGSSSVPRRDR